MNEQKIRELLIQAQAKVTERVSRKSPFGWYLGNRAVKGSNFAMNTIPLPKPVFRETQINGLNFQTARNAISTCGNIVEELPQQNQLTIVVMGGIEHSNPAVVIVSVKGNILSMTAYAREGLIRQDTANEAMDVIEDNIRK